MFEMELWLTPLILLPGVGLLVVSTAQRMHQINAELHKLLEHPDPHGQVLSRHLLWRATRFRNALVCLYSSAALFAVASFVGGLVQWWMVPSLWITGGLTLLGIFFVAYAALELVRESVISLRVLADHYEQIQHQRPPPRRWRHGGGSADGLG